MLHKISDLDERLDTALITEWQSPQGTRYRYDKRLARVGVELGAFGEWTWFETVKDKRAAKKAVFDAINADEA